MSPALRGRVATSTPQAVAAADEIFAEGGNTADAIVAAAAALVVTEPTGCGLGADAFAIVSTPGQAPVGLDASGRAPRDLRLDDMLERHLTRMPEEGWLPVTVPGVVSGWWALHGRFGRLPWSRVLEPAQRLAREGFEVPPIVARQWQRGGAERFGGKRGFEAFSATWLIDGERAPAAGERFCNPDLAGTLGAIAAGGRDAFYLELGPVIEGTARAAGGLMTAQDLREHTEEWVQPVAVRYRDTTVFELPPAGQGLVASMALAIAARLPRDPAEDLLGAPRLHRLAELLRQAIAEGARHIADRDCMRVSAEELLADERIAALAARVRDDGVAADPDAEPGGEPGTVYLAGADLEGMVISFIQSCYMGFGSGIVIPGHGISMQNRGCGFSLEPGHPNQVAPARRPFHTIIPGYLERDTGERMAFGCMGGPMQPQGHVQMVTALVDHDLEPQAICAMPRFRVLDGVELALEDGIPQSSRVRLIDLGHRIESRPGPWAFGGAQIATIRSSGEIHTGTDPRKDGYAVLGPAP